MMDALWIMILNGLRHVQGGLDTVFSPLHVLGPVAAVAVIALLTGAGAKLFTRKFKTRRYRELKKEFDYWYNLKQQALSLQDTDPEKARELGRNIDQGKLNKVYYDYFIEGFLNNLLTIYIPVFSLMGYVNATYRPEALESMFGRPYLFILPWIDGRQYEIGAVFWFVCCILGFYIISFISAIILGRRRRSEKHDDNAFYAKAL